jgi:hypothetical protein
MALQSSVSALRYIDEAVLIALTMLVGLKKFSKPAAIEWWMYGFLALFCLTGLLGNALSGLTVRFSAIAIDVATCLKFFLVFSLALPGPITVGVTRTDDMATVLTNEAVDVSLTLDMVGGSGIVAVADALPSISSWRRGIISTCTGTPAGICRPGSPIRSGVPAGGYTTWARRTSNVFIIPGWVTGRSTPAKTPPG